MLSKEREKELLDQYHADKAQREKELQECQAALDNFKAIMARNNAPRKVTTKKIHVCHKCGQLIPIGKAYYIPGRIAAVSSRNSDAKFTKAYYTCEKCYGEF
jgi:RNA polymerase-binding transcription factor DksA